MPNQIHVVSISPELNSGDQLSMKLVLAGESLDKAIQLLHNLEKSPNFRDPQILATQTDRRSSRPTRRNLHPSRQPPAEQPGCQLESFAAAGPDA